MLVSECRGHAAEMAIIAIIEPDPDSARSVVRAMQAASYATIVAREWSDALAMASASEVELAVLALDAQGDGLRVLRELRATTRTLPIVALATAGRPGDVVVALEAGADDAMLKPIRQDELAARVGRLLATAPMPHLILAAGDLELDLRRGRVRVGGLPITMTGRKLALLQVFLLHPREILSLEWLANLVDASGGPHEPAFVEQDIEYLRAELGPSRLEVVPGLGYRLNPIPTT